MPRLLKTRLATLLARRSRFPARCFLLQEAAASTLEHRVAVFLNYMLGSEQFIARRPPLPEIRTERRSPEF